MEVFNSDQHNKVKIIIFLKQGQSHVGGSWISQME